jgi:hypothetical protein
MARQTDKQQELTFGVFISVAFDSEGNSGLPSVAPLSSLSSALKLEM